LFERNAKTIFKYKILLTHSYTIFLKQVLKIYINMLYIYNIYIYIIFKYKILLTRSYTIFFKQVLKI